MTLNDTDPQPERPAAPWWRQWWVGVAGGVAILMVGVVIGGTVPGGPVAAPTVTMTATLTPPSITETVRATQTATATATVTATSAPVGPASSFGDGLLKVGADIQPGAYQATGADCHWARLSGADAELDSIIANNLGPSIVTIKKSDAYFESTRCGEWVRG